MRVKKIFIFCFIAASLFCFSCNEKEEKTQPLSSSNNVKELKLSLEKYPDSLMLIEKLIQYYSDNGEYDSALVITDDAIKKDSNLAELWDIKATLHFENEDTINSIRAFEKAISIYPLPEYVIALGTLYAQTKNPKALTLADALIVANKTRAEKDAIFIKGLYYNYTGDKKKAMSLFDSCIRIDYTYMFAYREKAVALYDLGKYEDALSVLSKAVTVQNNFDEGYYWMGKCYQKLNKTEEAIQSYHTALMYDKDFVEARDSLKVLEGK